IEYIEKHLDSELTLQNIAEYLQLDSFYLSHLFSKEVGITLHKYIIKKSMNKAKLMIDDGFPIKEVVSKTGFKDESHFIQSFKKEFNITPNKYRLYTRKN
ncbi:MAG: AraC family transcriptional regulator, partial [Bacilli bacterium]|nr:AraC family transcriptional regulator [Bacilli bacterium]